VVPECGGTPLQQIFLSRNGAPVNVAYHSWNRQISSYYKKVTLNMKFGQLVLRKIIEIVATRCHILRIKMHQIRFPLGLHARPHWGAYWGAYSAPQAP